MGLQAHLDKKKLGIGELEQIWGILRVLSEKNNKSIGIFKKFLESKKNFCSKKKFLGEQATTTATTKLEKKISQMTHL